MVSAWLQQSKHVHHRNVCYTEAAQVLWFLGKTNILYININIYIYLDISYWPPRGFLLISVANQSPLKNTSFFFQRNWSFHPGPLGLFQWWWWLRYQVAKRETDLAMDTSAFFGVIFLLKRWISLCHAYWPKRSFDGTWEINLKGSLYQVMGCLGASELRKIFVKGRYR